MKPYVESQYLHVFVTLARTLNMSEAARELGLTPSAISHALKALETNLGCRVFERSPRHMELLPAGHTLLADAVAILEQLRLLRTKADALNGKQETGISLSVTADFAQFLMPTVLQKFRVSYPDLQVKIEDAQTAKGAAALADGKVDLAIMLEPARNPALDFTLLGEDELLLIVNPQHEWANLKRIPLKEILSRKILVSDHDGQTTGWLTAYFKKEIPAPTFSFESANEDRIKAQLSANTGIALLPKWTVAEQIKSGQLSQVSLGRLLLKRRWVLATRKNHSFNTAETVLVRLIKALFIKVISS